MLKQGQIINDGENDLTVCATKKYEGTWYAYLLNEETDEVGFYKIIFENELYNFELVDDEKQIEELILVFAKDYATKNPEVFDNIKRIIEEGNDNN